MTSSSSSYGSTSSSSHTIPYSMQYFVEKDRNTKFQWLCVVVTIAAMLLHGIVFRWIPMLVRSRRNPENIKSNSRTFTCLKALDTLNSSFRFKLMGRMIYVQPSLYFAFAVYLVFMAIFSFVETIDLTYQPRKYIVAKRLGNLASGNLLSIYLLITKNDLICSLSGLKHDRLTRMHIWIARTTWLLATVHLSMCVTYWLDLNVPLMIYIPPQYFGMIAYASCSLLTWASFRFIRKWSYEVFLIQHRILSGIMLLFVLFHNPRNKAIAIISVHALVVDKVVSRIVGWIHSKRSPTKSLAQFSLLNEDTVSVIIPMNIKKEYNESWYNSLLPTIGTWKAGQYVYISVPHVDKVGNHPFTISSLSESGEIRLIIKKRNGFTKRLAKKVKLMEENDAVLNADVSKFSVVLSTIQSKINQVLLIVNDFIKTKVLKKNPSDQLTNAEARFEQEEEYGALMKLSINGPYGGLYQDLTKFDAVSFFSNGVGGSFTFPVCLHLLQTIDKLNAEDDYFYRPENPIINFSWNIADSDHISWYQDVFEQLVQFINDQKLKLTIHVTRLTEVDISEQICNYGKDAKRSSSDNSLATDSVKKNMFISSILENKNIDIIHHRVDVAENIRDFTQDIIDNNEDSKSKSIAVIGCGHRDFTKSISYECQKNRWVKNSPDIYCYCETF